MSAAAGGMVDVLAVLDAAQVAQYDRARTVAGSNPGAAASYDEDARRIGAARTAVADLIEAGKFAREQLVKVHGVDTRHAARMLESALAACVVPRP